MTKKIDKKGFESSLIALEAVVEKLESGELTLESSLEQFETGVVLYKECKNLLGKAEKKISRLTDSLKEEVID